MGDEVVPGHDPAHVELVARQAAEWLLALAEVSAAGLSWRSVPGEVECDPTLYHGAAGIVLALLEAHRHFQDDRFADAAVRGARAIAAQVDQEPYWSLYSGLTGMTVALCAVHTTLGDQPCSRAARRGLSRVRAAFDGRSWGPYFEMLAGNAGIALGALHTGDLDLAVLAATPYLHTADPTPGGLNWAVRPEPARSHHIAHGTLGIVHALAEVARASGRHDFLTVALAGAADVVSRNEAGRDGFLVPHSDPQHRPELIERYSYGWCNGPTGDSQTFRLLSTATGDPRWSGLVDRCWRTISGSGLPRRVRPGFWDSNGSCCGTAGVLALACDRIVEHPDPAERRATLQFATILVVDLLERAIIDADGARWSNHEHRAIPADLPARPGWAMGNAGILRELLRYARLVRGSDPTYAIAWPAHPPTGSDDHEPPPV